MNTANKKSTFFWAITLTVLGGLFLLRNFGLLDFHFPLRLISWRLIPLIIGINAFLKGKNVEGVIATSIAVIFYIPDFLSKADYAIYVKLWPLLLVALGGLIVYKFYNPKYDFKTTTFMAENSDAQFLNESNVMGGTNKKIFSKNFIGGRINCIMGGVQLDLTEADLGPNAALNVFILMGGAEIRAPKEWNIIIDVLPIMGGVEDQIFKYPASVVNSEKKIYLTGNVLMGGIEIKRY